MKTTLTALVMLALCLTLKAQDQFTNFGTFHVVSGQSITFLGDFVNNGNYIDSGTETKFAGIVPQIISGDSVTTFNNLTINNHSTTGVTLMQSVRIRGALKLDTGLLNTTATNILTMRNGATTLAGTSASLSYINGPMIYQKSTAGSTVLNFPIGKGSDCRPVSIIVNHSGTALYNYTSQSFNADAQTLGFPLPATISKISRVHYWSVVRTDNAGMAQPSANLNGNQTITIYFGANDFVEDGNTLRICKHSDSLTGPWHDIGGTGGPSYNSGLNLTGSITSTSAPTAFNSFSIFTLGNEFGGINRLPVELLSFKAEPFINSVLLNWSTASETNNAYFIAERSTDGSLFSRICKTPAHGDGNSQSLQTYACSDNAPLAGVSYYRLKQVNQNGSYEYSSVVRVEYGTKPAISFYPNPAGKQLTIENSEPSIERTATITDITGRVSASFALNTSVNLLDVSMLTPGIYYLVISEGNAEPPRILHTFKLIVK